MGKTKKGFNWRARQNVSGSIDTSETIKLNAKIGNQSDEKTFDDKDSNVLVLPSKKRKFKASSENEPVGKILSKKKRKHLEKVVERKKKKEERGELLEKLGKVQADSKLLEKMVSLSSVQTKGLKRQFAEEEWMEKMEKTGVTLEKVIVNGNQSDEDIELPKKIKFKKPKKAEEIIDDPNVLGFKDSGSSDEGTSDEETENMAPDVEEEDDEVNNTLNYLYLCCTNSIDKVRSTAGDLS